MKIYVGNLSYQMTEDELRGTFASFGQVESATIIMDKFSGRSKGFGFVEMPSKEEAQSAIDGLNGKELHERALNVNEAIPRPERSFDSGRRGGGRPPQGGGARRGGGGGRPQRSGGRDRGRQY